MNIGPKLREHLIEHLEGEVQWWEDSTLCSICCGDEDKGDECLYREAKRLLATLKEEITDGN